MNDNKLKIEFLAPDSCSFSINNNGFLIMTLGGESKGRVKLIRSYPYSVKDEYICVHDLDDNEIGIIKDLKELDSASKESAEKELESRYYCPVVTSVKSVKERMGNFYFQTVIDGKEKNFTVSDITKNMRFASDDTVLIFDMDGNRYIIPEISKIEPKSKRILDPYLY